MTQRICGAIGAVLMLAAGVRAEERKDTLRWASYLGGSKQDELSAVAVDGAGRIWVGGASASANLPGLAEGSKERTRVFVAGLDQAGAAPVVTVLAEGGITGVGLSSETVSAMAVRPEGGLWVAGSTFFGNVAVSERAWRREGNGGFLARLDGAGRVEYMTLLGTEGAWLNARQIALGDGVVYVAGQASATGLLGSAGAYQRELKGEGDWWVAALPAEGGAPLWMTLLGGSGFEMLTGLVRLGDGSLLLSGSTTSKDFPVTEGAWVAEPAATLTQCGVLARISADGSQLLWGSYTGDAGVVAMAAAPDGGVVVAGTGQIGVEGLEKVELPAAPLSGTWHVTKLAAETLEPVWTVTPPLQPVRLVVDGEGQVYAAGNGGLESGGSFWGTAAGTLIKLSADGRRLLLSTGLPVAAGLAVGPEGQVAVVGASTSAELPTTEGAPQPAHDPVYNWQQIAPNLDGWVGLVDARGLTLGNFFVRPVNLSFDWRLGDPAPEELTVLLQQSGEGAEPRVRAAEGSRLETQYLAEEKEVVVRLQTEERTAGTFQERIELEGDQAGQFLTLPVAVKVRGAAVLELERESLELKFRQGQSRQGAIAPIKVTASLGGDWLALDAESSDRSWLYASVSQWSGEAPKLEIGVGDMKPGVYEGTVRVYFRSGSKLERVVRVRYEVTEPVKVELSKNEVRMQVLRGVPELYVDQSVEVRAAVEGVGWSFFTGMRPSWVEVRQTAKGTPGRLEIRVDASQAPVGRYDFTISMYGENGQWLGVPVLIDVVSGQRLDVTPSQVTAMCYKGTAYCSYSGRVDVLSPEPADFEWSGESWALPPSGTGRTPATIWLNFDQILPEGIRNGVLKVKGNGEAREVALNWTLYEMPKAEYSTEPIRFTYQLGGPLPPAQTFVYRSVTLSPTYLEAGLWGYPSFVTLERDYQGKPAEIVLKPTPGERGPGHYETTMQLTPFYLDRHTYPPVPVMMDILADPNAPKSAVTELASEASGLAGPVSPGELVVVRGSGFAGGGGTAMELGAEQRYPAQYGGGRVKFDELEARIVRAAETEWTVVAPYGVAGRGKVQVVYAGTGTPSAALEVAVAETNPALYTADGTGSGPARAENVGADGTLTANTSENAAEAGSEVVLHATGLGRTEPEVLAGGLAASGGGYALQWPVKVLVGGKTAEVVEAGPEPGEVSGRMRIRIKVPAGLAKGAANVLVVSADNPSPVGVTLAVR